MPRVPRLLASALLLAACDGTAGGPELPSAPARLLAGHPDEARARLVGDGPSSCSTPDPASGGADRWCALSLPGPDDTAELWVLNVTRAGRGQPSPCDGTSPRCVRLTRNLWTGDPDQGPAHPFAHRFDGDTLIFHADALSGPDELYRGPVWAWRPGWAAPHVITTDAGVTCSGHPRAAVAVCIDTVVEGKRIEFDILAGPLAEDAGPLPRVGHVVPLRGGEASAWRASFSPRGDWFALSSLDDGGMREVLRVGRTTDLRRAPLQEIASDATRFEIAHDGQKIFWLRGYNYSVDGSPAGTLMMADFPTGANAVALQPRVGSFFALGTDDVERGVGFMQDVADDTGAFRVLPDRAHPDRVVGITDRVDAEDVVASPDGRYTAFLDVPQGGDAQTLLARNDGSGAPCVLGSRPGSPAFDVHFAPASGLVFWSEEAEDPDDGDVGFVGRPDGCAGIRRFDRRLQSIDVPSDRLLVYGVSNDDADVPGATLKLARLPGGRDWPDDGAVLVRAGIDDFIATVAARDAAQVVFQVAEGPDDQRGIYRFGPFSLTP